MVDDAPTPPEATPDEVESLPKAIGALFADLPGLLTDRVHLLSLELQRASNALGQMVALGLLAAILFATATPTAGSPPSWRCRLRMTSVAASTARPAAKSPSPTITARAVE